MMRLPLPVVLAALALVAAGSVVVTTLFKSGVYVVNVSGLAVGQNATASLSYIPHKIKILSNVTGAVYEVRVYADAAFVAGDGAVYYGKYVVANVPSNSTVVINVREVRATDAKIVVVRTA
jgi:hypothetical protein